VEFDVRVERAGCLDQAVIILGKTRARRFGNESYRLLDEFWNRGFDQNSADGICVPEPLGVIPAFQMWFQRKVSGPTATELVSLPGGVPLARRIAEATCKLNRAKVPADKQHSMADEMRILRECLDIVKARQPAWSQRLERVEQRCELLSNTTPAPNPCGIHRDFYPAQVIVDSNRLCLIDFDLYCQGDPALDIGNFLGHMIEYAVRKHGDPDALKPVEDALRDRFVELSDCSLAAVVAYTTLTLVRHVYLSQHFEEGQRCTEQLLALCEQRLDLPAYCANRR
jgi:hypothetical protein